MPQIQIRADVAWMPHSFLMVRHPDGSEEGFGLVPRDGWPIDAGHIQDDTKHPYNKTSPWMDISDKQYSDLMDRINHDRQDPPNYNFFTGDQCNTWLKSLLNDAGISPEPNTIAFLATLLNNPYIDAAAFAMLDYYLNSFNASNLLVSPIVLDLDKDGIETRALTGGAYFDHDKNGFAEKTGWVSSDDGLLALDRNGNGTIDDGGEIFGNNTLLGNGQKATNGFAALVELDENLDGKIDNSDAAFSQLKVWQDTDGNGLSTSDELRTLTDLGIKSIGTGFTASTSVDANGNTLGQTGSFTWNDDTTSTATDVWFANDPLFTIANEWLDVPGDIAALPELQGFGSVYTLRQTMVRDTSGQLKSLIQQFASATDITACCSLMEQIVFKWAGSDGVNPTSRGSNIDARRLVAMEHLFGQVFVGPAAYGSGGSGVGITDQSLIDAANPGPNAANSLDQTFKGLLDLFYAQLMAQTQLKDLYDDIIYTWDDTTDSITADVAGAETELLNRLSADPVSGKHLLEEFVRSLTILNTNGHFNIPQLRADLGAINSEYFTIIDGAGKTKIQGTVNDDILSGTAQEEYYINGEAGHDSLTGASFADFLVGEDGNDVINGAAGNDLLYGGAGNDSIYGQDGNDTLFGNEGDDILDGGNNDDTLSGGDGNDILKGGTGNNQVNGGAGDDSINCDSGNDQITGGQGNDTIWGGRGDDSYIFNKGDGQDTIYDSYYNYESSYNSSFKAGSDTLKFGENITPEDVVIGLSENKNLIVQFISSPGDRITIRDWINGSNRIEKFVFSDGTEWGINQIAARVNGTEGDDSISWSVSGATIKGLSGNDIITTDAYDDTLEGGFGNDVIWGGRGDDTYIFNKGDGQDTIYDSYYNYESSYNSSFNAGADTLKFGEDITPEDVFVGLSENKNLIVQFISNPGDRITIRDWINGSNRIEKFVFSNGTEWGINQIAAKVSGTEGDDSISWSVSGATIKGLSGNDTITTDAYDDTLEGGLGNDVIWGGRGDDTYIFNKGDGQDTIYDSYYNYESSYNSSFNAGSDTLKLGNGLVKNEIGIFNSGTNLIISSGEDSTATIRNQSNANNAIEKFVLSDGSYLTSADVNRIIQDITAFANSYGISMANVDDVRNHPDLMNIITASWRAPQA